MKILGIDPGTWRLGVGLIESQGNSYKLLHSEVITNKEKTAIANRLKKIYFSLKEIIQKYHPDVMALENVFYSEDPQALLRLGEARGCVMLAASEAGIDVIEYPPARVKQSVSGNGRATKGQVQQMVKTLLNLKISPAADAADALAVAICHLHNANRFDLRTQLSAAKRTKNPNTLRVVKY